MATNRAQKYLGDELGRLIERCRQEFVMSYAECLGCLFLALHGAAAAQRRGSARWSSAVIGGMMPPDLEAIRKRCEREERWLCFDDPDESCPCAKGTAEEVRCSHLAAGGRPDTCDCYRKVVLEGCQDCPALIAEVEKLGKASGELADDLGEAHAALHMATMMVRAGRYDEAISLMRAGRKLEAPKCEEGK